MTELALDGVRQHYPIHGGLFGRVVSHVHAVDRADVTVGDGRTLGVVGESGCGKTTLGRIIIGLLNPTEGRVIFDGTDLHKTDRKTRRRLRPRVQMVFQDTHATLDPRMPVEAIVSEPLHANDIGERRDRGRLAAELLVRCGLSVDFLQRYPHELSGGQRQRVVIARALATEPELIVLDEPTSALDVSVQAQVLNLLKDLQDERGLTYVFISHDLGLVRCMSDDVAVMYLGEVVEYGPTERIFSAPAHPYTRLLLSSVLRPDPQLRESVRLAARSSAGPPRADALPSGCRFHPRCPHAVDACSEVDPAPTSLNGRDVACIRAEELNS